MARSIVRASLGLSAASSRSRDELVNAALANHLLRRRVEASRLLLGGGVLFQRSAAAADAGQHRVLAESARDATGQLSRTLHSVRPSATASTKRASLIHS